MSFEIENGIVHAAKNGVTGDNVDCTAAFQALIDSVPCGDKMAPIGATIQLPEGTIRVSSTLDYKDKGLIRLRGTGNTLIGGNFPGPILGRNLQSQFGTGSAFISDLQIKNYHPQGYGAKFEGLTSSVFDKCFFGGYRGIVVGEIIGLNNTDVTFRDCEFGGGIGCAVGGGIFNFYGVRGFGCSDTVLQLSGHCGVFGSHFEVNNCAIRTGVHPSGMPTATTVCIERFSAEANLTSIEITKPTYFSKFSNLQIVCDKQNNMIWPNYGINIQPGASHLSFEAANVGGSLVHSAIRIGTLQPVSFNHVNAGNQGFAGSTMAWDIASPDNVIRTQCS